MISKRHSRDLLEIAAEDLVELTLTAQRLARVAIEELEADAVNALNCCGAEVWQSVFRLHLHLVPRYVDKTRDRLALPRQPDVPGDVSAITELGGSLPIADQPSGHPPVVEPCSTIRRRWVQRWSHLQRHRGVTELELSDSETLVLEEIYRELRLPLLRLGFMLTGSRETAEDLVQSAFASAQPRWDRIDDPPAYLRRSIVNLAKDSQRREFRRRRMLRPQPEPVTSIPELDETWALVRGLPPTQRAVVVLHYYEDLPLVEIGDLLDRPASTVRSDLRRALARLRKALP